MSSIISWFFKFLSCFFRLKFSKEDHVELIQLLWSVLHAPGLDCVLVFRTASALITLLKFKDTLKPGQDLTLEWRPLYDLFDRHIISSVSFPTVQIPR